MPADPIVDELRDHLNAEHGYTIPADRDVSRYARTLAREHAAQHGLCEACGGPSPTRLCPSCAAEAAHARIDADFRRGMEALR